MHFEQALKELREGTKVRVSDWKEGMYLVYRNGYPDGVPINQDTANATGIPHGVVVIFQPYLMLCLPDQSFVPYVPTMPELLGDRWQIVENRA